MLAALTLLPVVTNGRSVQGASGKLPLTRAQKRLEGLGIALVVDAVEGEKMLGNEFFADGSDIPFYKSSVTRKGNRAIMAFPASIVPEQVRVLWRDSAEIIGRPDRPSVNTYGGAVIGDYKVAVASRIPDDVVREIRKNGGGLRLKFRLWADGVLFGWDIERFEGGLPRHTMAGGDFLETWY